MVIISGSRDLTVRVWHFNTGFLLFELFGHSGCIYGVSIIRCLGKVLGITIDILKIMYIRNASIK